MEVEGTESLEALFEGGLPVSSPTKISPGRGGNGRRAKPSRVPQGGGRGKRQGRILHRVCHEHLYSCCGRVRPERLKARVDVQRESTAWAMLGRRKWGSCCWPVLLLDPMLARIPVRSTSTSRADSRRVVVGGHLGEEEEEGGWKEVRSERKPHTGAGLDG